MKNREEMHKKENKIEKEAIFLETAVLLQKQHSDYLAGLDSYIRKLKSQPADVAKEEAIKALKRTGVTTQQGNVKKKIVSWE